MEEIWKDIKGYEKIYQVSNLGRIKSLNYNRKKEQIILKHSLDNSGYCRVVLYKGGNPKLKLIHRLVGEAFIKELPNKNYINHKNGIKNDNRLENLEWCTRSENQIHAYKMGLQQTNQNMINARKKNILVCNTFKRKKVLQINVMGEIINQFESVSKAIKITGIRHISDCALGKCKMAGGFIWKY